MTTTTAALDEWKSTACILCSINCGLQVQVADGHFVKIKGDKTNPRSKGYTCEKPARLDHYQNHGDRLTSPLRRRPDGSFEAIDWDTAIREVAARLIDLRDRHGGEKIMYYGGGGQGNHLGGAYSSALRRSLGMRYQSNALAQEKTGEFWVERLMFGGRPEPDFEHSQVAVFVGKNPWQSHGFERARVVLKEIAKAVRGRGGEFPESRQVDKLATTSRKRRLPKRRESRWSAYQRQSTPSIAPAADHLSTWGKPSPHVEKTFVPDRRDQPGLVGKALCHLTLKQLARRFLALIRRSARRGTHDGDHVLSCRLAAFAADPDVAPSTERSGANRRAYASALPSAIATWFEAAGNQEGVLHFRPSSL